MGYGGKVAEQDRARALRVQSWTLAEIAAELGVAKSSVSLWVRDVDFVPRARRMAPRRPSSLMLAKQAEIEELRTAGLEAIGRLSEREFLVAGLALYAGEGAKQDGAVRQALPGRGTGYVPPQQAPPWLSERRSLVQPNASTDHRSDERAAILDLLSGVAQLAERRPVKPFVVGSSPTPGAPDPGPSQRRAESREGQ